MADNPWEPFDRLQNTVREALADLGVAPLAWVILPGIGDEEGDDGGRYCQIAIRFNDDAFLDDEAKRTRREFDAVLESTAQADREERIAEKAQNARERLIQISKGGGIFAEDEDDDPLPS